MKFIKKFENYVEAKPINFENVFGISEIDVSFVLGDLIDKYDRLGFELVSTDYKNFKIEIFDEDFDIGTKKPMSKEYTEFQQRILPNLKQWLDDSNIRLEKHELDSSRNRIIIHCKQIVPVKKS